MNNVNLFSMTIQLFQSLSSKGTLLANELFPSISFEFQTTNEMIVEGFNLYPRR